MLFNFMCSLYFLYFCSADDFEKVRKKLREAERNPETDLNTCLEDTGRKTRRTRVLSSRRGGHNK